MRCPSFLFGALGPGTIYQLVSCVLNKLGIHKDRIYLLVEMIIHDYVTFIQHHIHNVSKVRYKILGMIEGVERNIFIYKKSSRSTILPPGGGLIRWIR